jgi:hypothetical protein
MWEMEKGGTKVWEMENGVCDKEDKGMVLGKEVDFPSRFRRRRLYDFHITESRISVDVVPLSKQEQIYCEDE